MRAALTSLVTVLFGGTVAVAAQSPAATSAAAATGSGLSSPSALLQPPLINLQQTLNVVHPEKWKSPMPIREATEANIASIRRDLSATLPSLLTAADAAPNSVPSVLPVLRNVDALYDVLLRVTQESESGAPRQQSAALEEAMANLDNARRMLGDRLQDAAVAQERQVGDLQAALRARPVAAPVAADPARPDTATPEKKRKARAKPAPKAAVAPTKPTPNGSSSPQN